MPVLPVPAPTRRAAIPFALLFGIVLVGLIAEHVGGTWNDLPYLPILDLATGWTFVGCGLLSAAARPGQPAGGRLVLAGFLWFIGTIGGADPDLAHSLGFAFGGYHDLVLLWLALSFPGRWPGGAAARGILAVAALLFAGQSAVRLAATLPAALGSEPPDPGLITVIAWLDFLRAAAVVVGGMVVLVRLARVPRRDRRALGPVLAAGGAAAIASGYTARYAMTALGFIPDLGPDVVVPLGWVINVGRLLVPLAILLGVLRLRRARSAMTEAVVAVGNGASIADLSGALSTALGDPDLRVLEWRSDRQAFVDALGMAASREEIDRLGEDPSLAVIPVAASREEIDRLGEDPSLAVIPVAGGSEPLALIVMSAAIAEDPAVVAAGTALTRLVVRNEQQAARIEEQLVDVRASRARIVTAADGERRRIERDLHDGLQQRMVALAMQLRGAEGRGRDVDRDAALRIGSAEILAILEDVRELARGIHPAVLSEAGLGAAIQAAADRSPVPADVTLDLSGRGSDAVQATAYYVVSEALANVAKHAPQASGVSVRATDRDGFLRVVIDDDGPGGAVADGHGLAGLADRVAALDGRFRVEDRPEGGTRLTAEVPIP
jgi:signal transduction histidine kinase